MQLPEKRSCPDPCKNYPSNLRKHVSGPGDEACIYATVTGSIMTLSPVHAYIHAAFLLSK